MSSSTNSAFLRALSPSLNAITNAIISTTFAHDNNIDDKNIQLSNELIANFHGKLSSASSIDQLLTCIYPEYQDAIKEKVLEYASWADKWEMSKTSCNRLSSSATAGSTPQRLRVTAPADTYQKSIANCALTAKQVEVLFWQGKCNVESATQVLDGLLSERWKAVQKTSLVPSIIIDENGTTNLGPWEVSPQKIAEGVVMRRAVPLIINRILDIVEIRHRALSRKIEKKSAVSKKAEQALGDVEPKDVGAAVAGPSIQSLIDKGLNARLEKLESAKKPKKTTSGGTTPKTTSTPTSTPKKAARSPAFRKAKSDAIKANHKLQFKSAKAKGGEAKKKEEGSSKKDGKKKASEKK